MDRGLPDAPGGGGTEGQHREQLFSGSVDNKQARYHTRQVGRTSKNIKVEMTGQCGDADPYTRFTDKPTESSYDCRPYESGSSESCSHPTSPLPVQACAGSANVISWVY